MTIFKKLGQNNPGDTNPQVLCRKDVAGTYVKVTEIVICNTTGGALTYRIFHAKINDFILRRALVYDKSIAANDIFQIAGAWYLNEDDEAIGVRSSAANGLVFTAFGEVV